MTKKAVKMTKAVIYQQLNDCSQEQRDVVVCLCEGLAKEANGFLGVWWYKSIGNYFENADGVLGCIFTLDPDTLLMIERDGKTTWTPRPEFVKVPSDAEIFASAIGE